MYFYFAVSLIDLLAVCQHINNKELNYYYYYYYIVDIAGRIMTCDGILVSGNVKSGSSLCRQSSERPVLQCG